MASTYSTNLGIELPATGEQSGTWGGTVNTNMNMIDAAINGIVTKTLGAAGSLGSPNDINIPDGSTTSGEGRYKFIIFNDGGDLGATTYVRIISNAADSDCQKIGFIKNSLSGSQDLVVMQGDGSGGTVTVQNGNTALLSFDGGGTGAIVTNTLANLQLDTKIAFPNAADSDEISIAVDASDDITVTVNSTEAAKYDSSETSWNLPALTVATNKVETFYEKDITIESPTDSENIGWFYTNRAITVTELVFVTKGTSPSTLTKVMFSANRNDGSPTAVVTAGTTVTSESTGHVVSSFDDATIPANQFVWIETGTQSGTVTELSVHLEATID